MNTPAASTIAPLAHEDFGLIVSGSESGAQVPTLIVGLLWTVAIAALSLLAWRRVRRRISTDAFAVANASPRDIALAELDEWQAKIAPFDPRGAITAASASLRRCLAASSTLPAPMMTTEELTTADLAERSGIDDRVWCDFAERSDRIKFAGLLPERSELELLFDLARQMVRSVRTREDRP